MVEVSAKKKENLDLLLEMILLVTELSELKANPKRNASGTVLEAKLDKGRGPVATILVQDGTLRVGDTFIAGTIVGKVRALIDDRGRQIKGAGPATPVEVLGLGGLPAPGDAFQALTDAAKARQIALFRQTQAKEKALGGKGTRLTLESLQQQIAEGDMHTREIPAGRQTLSIETGRLAKQADGAVIVRSGDTMVLVTACTAPTPREGIDFLPLTVDYKEYTYASGRIPGGFFKREGKPTEKEVLTSRLIDRPIRPLFPSGWRNETQVIALVLSADDEHAEAWLDEADGVFNDASNCDRKPLSCS